MKHIKGGFGGTTWEKSKKEIRYGSRDPKRPPPDQPRTSRASMIAAGNPDVLKEAFTPANIAGLTPTQRGTNVWRESVRAGTPVQHVPGKVPATFQKRGRPITY